MPNKRKNVTIDEDRKKQKKIDDDVSPPSYLPEDLVLENVLTRLPAKDLARFTSVSKLWYDSILNDKRFAASHFGNNQNRRNLIFNLLNVPNKYENAVNSNYFFRLHKDDDDDRFYNFKMLSLSLNLQCWIGPVGNCNGLICVRPPSSAGLEQIIVINPFKWETLGLTYITPKIVGGGGGSLEYLCHGFGFDSDSVSQEYKIVVIYTTKTTGGDRGFICMVVTLGVRSWRKIVISTSEISPPGSSPFPSQTVTRIPKLVDKSATICGGDLFWRITNTRNDGSELEMLLSFDIHNEKIQFIQLPTKCNSMIPTMNEDGCLEIGHHVLEFKGYPCVARSEKIYVKERIRPGSDKYRFCYYQLKVHLCILKDKVKQTWIEEEAFDVRFMEDSVRPNSALRNPFDRYFNKTEHSNNHQSHPTRMFSFSDQLILYWFDGGCLIFYNLRMKHHNVVKGTRSCNERIRDIFEAKITGLPVPDMHDDLPECPCTDFQLHAQVENIISLETFIPEGGEVREFDTFEEFVQFVSEEQLPVGWVNTGRKPEKWHAFF